MEIEKKIEEYIDKIVVYNPYALLEAMFYLESIEEYEECAIILKALKRYNAIYKESYPTNKKGYQLEKIAKYFSIELRSEIEDFRRYIISEFIKS